ncbi:hypothetical protein MRB53_013696 [Persea americana]|uniref:Uncharacterized protein n=1 Tax=Persea americana TaxID=3435 RepID=A0ACC2K8T4_PERAE|nr:hypothetical protein MRB53_013696 [Persea americana]
MCAERNNNSSRIIVILIPTIAVAIILFIMVNFFRIRKKKTDTSAIDQLDGSATLLQIDFETIRVATGGVYLLGFTWITKVQ